MVSAALPAILIALFALQPPQEEGYREREVLDPGSDQWIPEAAPDSVDGALPEARRQLVIGNPRKSESLLEDWVAENPEAARYYEGIYLLAESHFEQGDYFKAYEYFEQVVENTGGELFNKALLREMDVARAFLSGKKRRLWGVFRISAYDEGIEILDRIGERVPGTRLAEEAVKLKADYYFETGELDLAQDEYVALARDFPGGRYAQLALLRAAEAAAASYPGTAFTDEALLEADERYRQVDDLFPAFARREGVDTRREGIREQRAEKDLAIGVWYEKVGRLSAAGYYYRLVRDQWPETLAATEAEVRLRGVAGPSGAEAE